MDSTIKARIEAQREYFATQATKDINFRRAQLKALRQALSTYEKDIYAALWEDLHKSEQESYLTEISIVKQEIDNHLRHLRGWARPQKVRTNITMPFARNRIVTEPLGNTLIISPFNYPVQLSLNPLIGAISAGCCAILKTSREVPAVSRILHRIISDTFDERYITVIEGGRDVNEGLLAERFDFIFFTGSTAVRKVVMKAASENLTPVLLELGGKSPCIVDAGADTKMAARRIAWGKGINAGQTCIAPDYLLVHRSVKRELIGELSASFRRMYGDDPASSPFYPRIVNDNAIERLTRLMSDGKIIYGGVADPEKRYISPTIIDDIKPDDKIMEQEIFGPLLPILTYDDLPEAISYINGHEKPLALYFFGDRTTGRKVLAATSSGGACIDDTLMHIANHRLPFGGVGNSGIGKYHGRDSFLAFSNRRAVVTSPLWLDMAVKYPPFKHFAALKKFI